MNSRERIQAACEGQDMDFVPASFWGHDYAAETSLEGLVEYTVRFQREYGWDFIKINPRAQYHVEDWGVRYDYPAPAGSKCVRTDYPIHSAKDYARITRLDPLRAPVLSLHLDAVEQVARAFPEVPVVMTVFNPLSVLKYAAESEHAVVEHLRQDPAAVLAALAAVRETFCAFSAEVVRRGAAGLFLATTAFASHDLWEPAAYRIHARADDLELLKAAGAGSFHVMHVCRARNFLGEFRDYPVQALSWAATEPGNSGVGDRQGFPGAAIGGISQEDSLVAATPEAALAEWQVALDSTGGRRFIAGPGCSIPPGTPSANLHALREAAKRALVR